MINKICIIDVENLVLPLNMLVLEASLTSSLELGLLLALYVCWMQTVEGQKKKLEESEQLLNHRRSVQIVLDISVWLIKYLDAKRMCLFFHVSETW